ncbi:MAG TPA: hypothetical protein VG734_07275 [Lacunisphaera sp.]|nr:hypothetical protein [Lacunisphaera sp.]
MATPDEYHTPSQPGNVPQSENKKPDPNPIDVIKTRLAALPPVTNSEWKVARQEIVEELSKNWRFKLQVAGIIVAVPIAILAVLGYKTFKDVENARNELAVQVQSELVKAKKETDEKIGTAKAAIADQIANDFKDPGIQETIREVAAEQAKNLLSGSVQPTIDSFNKNVETRLTTFDEFLKAQQKSAAADLESLRKQLEILQLRNMLVGLGDAAVANGNVKAYRLLEEISAKKSPEILDTKSIATSELVRVFSAYSFAAPTRIDSLKIDAKVLNSTKTKEEELTAEDIIPFLPLERDPIARARLASLISKNGKRGSFRTAEALATAIKAEENLEALRYQIAAFDRITGGGGGGKLDGSTQLEWWAEHKEEIREKDTDKPAEPAK